MTPTATCATLFTGGGLADVGFRAAGLTHIWGIERSPEIADVARANGFAVTVADILDCDPDNFERPTLLHASPPCPNFSQAKAHGVETPLDRELGEKVGEFIDVLRPPLVTLENVYGYRKSRAFAAILRVLDKAGYLYDVAHVDASDYGVPQSRRRLWLRAVRGGLVPHLPPVVRPKPGWYAAIEDLIPELPVSRFAPWQEARLPHELIDRGVMVNCQNQGEARGRLHRLAGESTMTVINGTPHRAFIVSNAATELGDGMRDEQEPACAVTGETAGRAKAFLVGGQYGQPQDVANRPPRISKHPRQAWLSAGRVVSMTPRALARFQSVPDSYLLPNNKRLACTVISNGCPPRLVETLARGLLAVLP